MVIIILIIKELAIDRLDNHKTMSDEWRLIRDEWRLIRLWLAEIIYIYNLF